MTPLIEALAYLKGYRYEVKKLVNLMFAGTLCRLKNKTISQAHAILVAEKEEHGAKVDTVR